MNEFNIRYIREITHISCDLIFWMKTWSKNIGYMMWQSYNQLIGRLNPYMITL